MTKNHRHLGNLSEAIEKLETEGHGVSSEAKEFLEKEMSEIRKKIQDLQPYLNQFKEKAEVQVKKTKKDIEEQVKESPWMSLGVVGLLAFLLGWFLGFHKRDR